MVGVVCAHGREAGLATLIRWLRRDLLATHPKGDAAMRLLLSVVLLAIASTAGLAEAQEVTRKTCGSVSLATHSLSDSELGRIDIHAPHCIAQAR